MPSAVVKLIAILLLAVQGMVALAPGRVLCIRLQDCETHQKSHSACGHCDVSGCVDDEIGHDEPSSQHGHERGLFITLAHPADECGCHLHVPIPNHQQVASTQKPDGSESMTVLLPLVVAVVACWDFAPPKAVNARFHAPDFSLSDQVRALKSTRLLV
jgi:hypothetical protein